MPERAEDEHRGFRSRRTGRPRRCRGDHRPDRQVDAPRRDHERHADRQHADDARLAQDVEHVVRGQERRRARGSRPPRAGARRRRPARTPGSRTAAAERQRGARARGERVGSVVTMPPPACGDVSVCATAWLSSSTSSRRRTVQLGDDRSLAHHEDARAQAEQLLGLGRDHHDGDARLRQLDDQRGRSPASRRRRRRASARRAAARGTRASASARARPSAGCRPDSSRASRSGSSGLVLSARSCSAAGLALGLGR